MTDTPRLSDDTVRSAHDLPEFMPPHTVQALAAEVQAVRALRRRALRLHDAEMLGMTDRESPVYFLRDFLAVIGSTPREG